MKAEQLRKYEAQVKGATSIAEAMRAAGIEVRQTGHILTFQVDDYWALATVTAKHQDELP